MSARTWKQSDCYRVVRVYQLRSGHRRTLLRGLSLEQAQAHCQDINTSSSTCWTTSALARTRRYGAWFDCYEKEG